MPTVTATIDRPVEEVFDFLLDSRNDERWCPMVSGLELVEGEPGVGALYRWQQQRGPGQSPITQWSRTTVADRPTRIEWTNDGRGLDYHAVVELTDLGGRTRVRQRNTVDAGGPVDQALYLVASNVVLRLQLRRLRRALGG